MAADFIPPTLESIETVLTRADHALRFSRTHALRGDARRAAEDVRDSITLLKRSKRRLVNALGEARMLKTVQSRSLWATAAADAVGEAKERLQLMEDRLEHLIKAANSSA